MSYVFIHGLGQTPDSWDRTIEGNESTKNAYRPNLSQLLQDKEINYNNLYKAFEDYCNRLDEPLNLCGLSLGGVIALQYAIENPTKVNSMVLIATQYQMPKKLLTFQNIIFKFMPEKMFGQMGFKKRDFIELSKSMMDIDFSDKLKEVKCPVLVLCGEKDSPNKKASVGLAAELPNAKLHWIANSGHEVNVDNPEKLAAELYEFF